ncbi:MAG: translation initiation factor IF-3 [Alphaproteobacteria bacterium]|nr:translation initiation factor IF-3 [Rickettsiales bacterium]
MLSESGEMLGVFSITDAMLKADSLSVDLIEVSPNVSPPVCKLMRFSKYTYLAGKKSSSNSSGSKKTKEIKMGISIGVRDLEIKVKKGIDFLQSGHALKVSIRMRGRELAHKDIADTLMKKIAEDFLEVSRLNDRICRLHNTVHAIFIPVNKSATADIGVAVKSSNSLPLKPLR